MKQVELFNDHFQNFKVYGIPKAQLIIADPPYNLGVNAYASNPSWYVDGDNKNGESDKAGKEFFDTDKDFRPAEFMHFCSQMLVKEPKESGKAPCMIVFCEFEQQFKYIELGKRYGFNHYINLVFRKNFSAQVLKANMKIVGNCEYGVLLYRDKLPKFNNGGGYGFQLHGLGARHPDTESSSHTEARPAFGTSYRDIHGQGGCCHRPLRRERNNAFGRKEPIAPCVWF